MKIQIFILFICFTFAGCEFSIEPEPEDIHKKYGTVSWNEDGFQNEIMTESFNIYHFGDYTDNPKTPQTEGFKSGDYVYFEAKVIWTDKNAQGGSTYRCKLLQIRKG